VIDLGASLAVFVAMWLLHVAWFRVSAPRASVRALLLLFSMGFVIVTVILAWAASRQQADGTVALPATALVLYVLLSLAYTIIYTAVEVDSPSALIVLLVNERGGMTFAELREILTDDNLVIARVRDLVTAGSVSAAGDQFRLERGGALIARIFAAYRGLLGRDLGG